MFRVTRSLSNVSLSVILFLGVTAIAEAQGPPPGVPAASQAFRAGVFDISPPLRNIPPIPEPAGVKRIHVHEWPMPAGTNAAPSSDTAVQTYAPALAPTAPSLGPLSFDGVGVGLAGFNPASAPPDTDGEVGRDHFVQAVNSSFAIFSKSGALAYGPATIKTLFSGFPNTDGNRCAKNNDGDPVVLYDQLADRWMITQFDVTRPAGATSDYQCVAISTSGDPTGSYYRYSFTAPGNLFGDYEKLGVWPDAYYMTTNQFSVPGGTFQGAAVLALERDKMLIGDPTARQLYVDMGGTVGSLLPADLDGSALPPAGSPNYLMNLGSGTTINLRKATVNWATPSLTVSAATAITVTSYSNSSGATVPQPGTTNKLDTLGGRMMFRLGYRNMGSYEVLVVNNTVDVGAGKNAVEAPRWYEIRNPAGTPTVTNQGSYSPTGDSRWMASMATDKRGNIGIGYSISNATTIFPSINFTGRAPGDAANTLQAEATMHSGTGSQFGANNLTRWGDYSQLTVDPVDDCTMWYTTEYLKANGEFNWSTRIGSFKFADCATCTAPATPGGVTVTASSATSYTVNWAAVTGATYNVYRQNLSCPLGSPVKLNVAAITGTSYLDITAVSGTTYWYSVSSVDVATANCESARSACVQTTTGNCTANPSFGGVTGVDAYTLGAGGVVTSNGCSLTVRWTAGKSNCPTGANLSYNVYRSITPGFTPLATNLVAKCVSNTFYNDATGLAGGTRYYYAVHAEDSTAGNGGTCNSGNEDKNNMQLSAVTGNYQNIFYENFDGAAAGAVPAGWSSPVGQWRGAKACAAYSSPNIIKWGGNDCATTQYTATSDDVMTSPVITVGAVANQLSLWHRWNFFGSVYDGGHLRVSVNGAAPVEIPSAAFLSGGYTANRSTGDACSPANSFANLGIWGGQQATFIQTVIDLEQVCGTCAGKTVQLYFNGLSNCTATNDFGWYIDDVQIIASSSNTCTAPPVPLKVFTVTSKNLQNTLEWNTGASGTRLVLRYSTTAFPIGVTDGIAVPGSPVTGLTANSVGSLIHTGLTNGTTYYYSAFVDGGAGTAISDGRFVKGTPFLPGLTGSQWAYTTGAANLSPTGGSVVSVSNDRIMHNTIPGNTATSGTWPATWVPFILNNPIQNRPRMVNANIGSATKVVFAGSQDGKIYCVNADTGALVWSSNVLGTMIQAGISGTLTQFGSTYNVLMAGTRNSSGGNAFVGVSPVGATMGNTLWSFTNGGGASSIGIINGAAAIDAAGNRAYFASRSLSGGSTGTVWCLNFTDVLNATPTLCTFYPLPLGDIDGSTVLSNGILYVGTNSGTLYAITASTGATLWSSNLGDGPIKGNVWPKYGASPATVYLSTTNKVWSVSAPASGSTGVINWSTPLNAPSQPYFSSATGNLYIGGGDGKLHQLTATTGAETVGLTLGNGLAAVGTASSDSSGQLNVGTDAGIVYSVVVPY